MSEQQGYWWCPECKAAIDGCNVTFSEHHDVCGTAVICKEAQQQPTDNYDYDLIVAACSHFMETYQFNSKFSDEDRLKAVTQLVAAMESDK